MERVISREDQCEIWQNVVATVVVACDLNQQNHTNRYHTQSAGRNKNNNFIDLESFCEERELWMFNFILKNFGKK